MREINSKGQSLIDFVLVSSVITVAATGLFVVTFKGFLHLFTKHYVYEAMLCNISQPKHFCQSKLEQRIRSFPMVKDVNFRMKKIENRSSYRVYATAKVDLLVCDKCKPQIIKDTVYVPKTFKR